MYHGREVEGTGVYFTFSKIRKRLMTRLMQYIMSPMPTRIMRDSWSSQIWSPVLPSKEGMLLGGRGSSLYHDIRLHDTHGIIEVKKLSKDRESAADQAQMNKTSERVWTSLADVRQRPRGRPRYSSCVCGEKVMVHDIRVSHRWRT